MTPGLALPLLLAVAAGDPVRVAAVASKTELSLGESVVVDVTAAGPAGATFDFPTDAGNDSVELHEVVVPEGQQTLPVGAHRYEAVVLALGDVDLPPITVTYRLADGTSGTAATGPVRLHVQSVLPKDPKQRTLADIRGPVPLTIGTAFWIAVGIATLLALGFAAWLRHRRRPAPPQPGVVPEVAADQEALFALDRLAGAGLVERGDYRGYYVALAEIVKRYLERRLAAPVLEMTSAEMAAFLRDHAAAAPFAATLREMAGAADQVKFARGRGLEDEARRHLEAARGVVRGLEAKLLPAPARVA